MAADPAQAARVAFPVAVADTTGVQGVMRIAVSGAGSTALPFDMRGKFLRVQPIGCDMQVAVSYGAAGQTLVLNQASAPGTGHAAAGATVLNGTFLEGLIPIRDASNVTAWINYIPVSGTGNLELWCSEQVVQ